MKVVITGETSDGTSRVIRRDYPDELVASGFPQFGSTSLDGSDAPITLPNDGARRRGPAFVPPAGGFRFLRLRIDPQSAAPATVPTAEQWQEAEDTFPGLFSNYDESGFERTDTVDFGYVVSGSVAMVLGDGSETVLEAGDAFVQNGTRHRWYNPGSVPAVFVVFLSGRQRTRARS